MSSWISSFVEMAPSSVQISWTLWQILQLFLLRKTGKIDSQSTDRSFLLKEEEEEVAEEVTEADLEGGVKNEGFEKSEEVETAEL